MLWSFLGNVFWLIYLKPCFSMTLMDVYINGFKTNKNIHLQFSRSFKLLPINSLLLLNILKQSKKSIESLFIQPRIACIALSSFGWKLVFLTFFIFSGLCFVYFVWLGFFGGLVCFFNYLITLFKCTGELYSVLLPVFSFHTLLCHAVERQ